MSVIGIPAFQALIVPHRSLTRRGVMTVVGALGALSVLISLRFWLLGAWPVAAFSLLEVPVVGVLLLLNMRGARASELIMLTEQDVTVIRIDARGGRQQQSLPSAWLRINLEQSQGAPRLMLSSHGQGWEVGAFLHEPEKLSLFEALCDALHRVRNPRFENPQLD